MPYEPSILHMASPSIYREVLYFKVLVTLEALPFTRGANLESGSAVHLLLQLPLMILITFLYCLFVTDWGLFKHLLLLGVSGLCLVPARIFSHQYIMRMNLITLFLKTKT